jgi:hypothetical protein
MFDILVRKSFRRLERKRLLLFHGMAFRKVALHLKHGIDWVHSGWASCFEGLEDQLRVLIESGQIATTKGAKALNQSVSGCGPNCACASDHHVFDGPGRGAETAWPKS